MPSLAAARVNHTVRQYVEELEQQNPMEEPVHQQDQVSTTDPDSTYATKGGTPARLGYYDNYLVDNRSCVIVGVQATAARMSQETVAAQDMLTRFTQWQGREPERVGGDTTYGNGEVLQWLADRSITPYMRTRDSIHRKRSPFFGPERFIYEPENNRYICPAGQALNYGGWVHRNRAYNYIGTRKKCGPCSLRPQCTSAAFRGLVIHQNEPARQRARELVNTPEFANAQRQRKKVEALFAELKNQIGLRRLRLRRLRFVREQFFLAAVAQNTSDWCASSVSQQPRVCRPPLSRTETRKPATACSQMKRRFVEGLFQHPQPLTLTTLAALIPPQMNAEVTLIDEGIQEVPESLDADLVGLTVITGTAPRAYELARHFRSRGIATVLGGPHVTLVPDDAQPHADSIIVGYAEDTWPQLLRDFAAGRMQRRYDQAPDLDLARRPFARRDLLPSRRFLTNSVFEATRGCVHNCDFCVVPAAWGRKPLQKPVEDVTEDIRRHGARKLIFVDLNLIADRGYAMRLFKALVPLKVQWYGLSPGLVAD